MRLLRRRRRKTQPVTLLRAKEVADQLGMTLDEFFEAYYARFPTLPAAAQNNASSSSPSSSA